MEDQVHAVGIDLAWGDNPTGVAHLAGPFAGGRGPGGWRLLESRTLPSVQAVVAWIASRIPSEVAVQIAVDAPLVATNAPGTQRQADLDLTAAFRRFRTFCLPVDVRHATRGAELRRELDAQGITYSFPGPAGPDARRAVFETFPTAAQLSFFDITRPLRYKRGSIDMRREGLRSLQLRLALMEDAALPLEETSSLRRLFRTDPGALRGAQLKTLEDELDALLCALVAALAWTAPERLLVYGDLDRGAIAVPHPPVPL